MAAAMTITLTSADKYSARESNAVFLRFSREIFVLWDVFWINGFMGFKSLGHLIEINPVFGFPLNVAES